MRSSRPDSYNNTHLLENGRAYAAVLIPGTAIPSAQRFTESMSSFCGEMFGYHLPLAGHVIQVAKLVTGPQMQAMNLNYITGLHDPIKDDGDDKRLLYYSYDAEKRFIDAWWVHDEDMSPWHTDGAFIFLDPQHMQG